MAGEDWPGQRVVDSFWMPAPDAGEMDFRNRRPRTVTPRRRRLRDRRGEGLRQRMAVRRRRRLLALLGARDRQTVISLGL